LIFALCAMRFALCGFFKVHAAFLAPNPTWFWGFFLLFFNQSFSTGRLSVLAIFLFISIILVSLYNAGHKMAYLTSCLDTPQLLAISAYPIFFLRSSILISNGVMARNIFQILKFVKRKMQKWKALTLKNLVNV